MCSSIWTILTVNYNVRFGLYRSSFIVWLRAAFKGKLKPLDAQCLLSVPIKPNYLKNFLHILRGCLKSPFVGSKTLLIPPTHARCNKSGSPTTVASSRETMKAIAHGEPLRCGGSPRWRKWRGDPQDRVASPRRCLPNALAPLFKGGFNSGSPLFKGG